MNGGPQRTRRGGPGWHQLGLGLCQRWREGRATYRPAGEPFDARWASVEPIDEAQAKHYVTRHHYSASYPAARFRAGLVIKRPFEPTRLVGVGVFSVPMNQHVIGRYFPGMVPNSGVELGRFVLDEDCAANAESWALARMFKLVRSALPDVRGVIAYCDPSERHNAHGELVKRGHVGTIYRATNASYQGRSAKRTLWLTPTGACVSERSLSKLRGGECGERYVREQLVLMGSPTGKWGESGEAYVARLKDSGWLRPVAHPGNHVFTWEARP